MTPKTIKNSIELGDAIKNRRNNLGLTIEEAAAKAGIGTKTWSRYESGGSIRRDKVKSLCKALNWAALPAVDGISRRNEFSFDEYENNKAWSPYLAEEFGRYSALSFVIGSEILLDEVNSDLETLSEMPKGTHIGEIPDSFISSMMPKQFLMRYDYEFMFALRDALLQYIRIAPHTNNMIPHRVIDELVLHLIVREARLLMEEMEIDFDIYEGGEEAYEGWDEWVGEICGDIDLITFLYSDLFNLTPDITYHFDNWFKRLFYADE